MLATRQKVLSRSYLFERLGRFQDRHIVPFRCQCERRLQASNTGTDDHDLEISHFALVSIGV